jgi:hypothetical protein
VSGDAHGEGQAEAAAEAPGVYVRELAARAVVPGSHGEAAVSSRWWMPVLLVLAVAGSMAVALVFAYLLLAVVAFVGWL